MANKNSRYSIRFRECDRKLIEFAKLQSNFTDTVRYLIEKEIYQNGLRDIQSVIPIVRDETFSYDTDGGDKNE